MQAVALRGPSWDGVVPRLSFLAAALLAVSVAAVCHADVTPRDFVRALGKQAETVVQTKGKAGVDVFFTEQLDMPLFSRRCLTDHWDEFSPDERLRYQDLLAHAIRGRMTEKALLAPDDAAFRLLPQKVSTQSGGLLRVDNVLRVQGDDNMHLAIFLVKQGEDYKIVDYDFEGILVSRNYRGQFNYLLRKYGKAGFFDKLESTVQESD